jgi:hypothetical protein
MEALEKGPAALVPAAWMTVQAALYTGIEAGTLITPMLLAMLVAQMLFLGLGWQDMEEQPLRSWRTVIMFGILFTAWGLGSTLGSQPVFGAASLGYWALAPAWGLWRTYESTDDTLYAEASGATALGALGFFGAVYAGFSGLPMLALVGLGQTVGIWRAVLQNS